MPNRRFLVLYVLVAAVSLWLRSVFPVFAVGASGHDDMLFVDLAQNLAFNWLGPYSQYTLAKGMFYPLFILTAFFLGIPVKLAEHAAYLGACGFAAWLVVRLSGNRWLGLVLFVVLAFNPVLWTPNLARVIREGVYVPLSLALVTLAAAALLLRGPQAISPRRYLAILLVLGIIGADFWLTREEGLWILPALLLLLLYAAAREWLDWRRHPSQTLLLRRILSLAAAIAIPAAVFVTVTGAVAGINYWRYGLFTTNEFRLPSFKRAYGALARIQHNEWRRYVVFPRDARARAYSVSPAARELEPYFEGPRAEGWRKTGCEAMKLTRCPEIPAAWFMWSLREAVEAAGHYRSGGEADAYYGRLASEINAACDASHIPCLPPRATMATPFRWHYLSDALAPARTLVGMLTHPHGVAVATSVGAAPELAFFEEMVGPLARAPQRMSQFNGSVALRDALPEISLRDTTGAPFSARIEVRLADNAEQVDGFRALRFELATDCLRESCELVVRGGTFESRVPISQLTPGRAPQTSDMRLRIDKVVERGDFAVPVEELKQKAPDAYAWLQPVLRPAGGLVSIAELRQALLVNTARAIAAAYATLLAPLAALAMIGVMLAAAAPRRFRSDPWPLAVLALACAVAVATRVALLAYLDVTSIPAVNELYLSPATPLFLLFVVIGVYLAGACVVGALRGGRPASAEASYGFGR